MNTAQVAPASKLAHVSAYHQAMQLVVLTPAQMESEIGIPTFQRKVIPESVEGIAHTIAQGIPVAAGTLIEGTFPEEVQAGQVPTKYLIVDGRHRRDACILRDIPMAFNVIKVSSHKEARDIFCSMQKGRKIDASYLIYIHQDDPVNKTIIQINRNKRHAMFNRIWFGGPNDSCSSPSSDQLRAAKIKSLVDKYGLPLADLSGMLEFLGHSYSIFPKALTYAGNMRALVQFYLKAVKEEAVFDITNAEHVSFLTSYPWANEEDEHAAANNTKKAGNSIYESLRSAFNRYAARQARRAA